MTNFIVKFWYGKVTLWKSYWLIGELLNSIVIFLVINMEIRLFENNEIITKLPFIDFSSFNFFTKCFLFFWNLFITIGIWRSAENYKGNFIWILLTLLFLSYRIFTLRLIIH